MTTVRYNWKCQHGSLTNFWSFKEDALFKKLTQVYSRHPCENPLVESAFV